MGTTHLYAPYGLPTVTITTNWLANIIVAAIFTSLGTLMLVLRLLTILLRRRPCGRDDWAIYAAFFSSIGYTIASIISLRWGVGLKTAEVPAGWSVNAVKAIYAVEIFYYLAVFLVKMSILLMYLNISRGLGSGDRFRKFTLWTIYLITLHFITTVIVTGAQCIPLSRYWNGPSDGGHCINITAFFYSTNIFTIFTDILILALPIPTLWRLQMPRKKRLGLIAIFGVGVLDTVASGIRLMSVRKFMGVAQGKGLEAAAPINTWSFVEIYLGIVCACVPGMTLFSRHFLHSSWDTIAYIWTTAIQGLLRRPGAHSTRSNTPATTSGDRNDRHRSKTSRRFNSGTRTTSTHPHHPSHQSNEISLDDLPPKGTDKRRSHFGLQSAVMTTSQGSLRNYSQRPSRAGTEGSSAFRNGGGPAREVREGV